MEHALNIRVLKMNLRYSRFAPDHIVKAVNMLDKTPNSKSELFNNYIIGSIKGVLSEVHQP
jgi:hypothetical protein